MIFLSIPLPLIPLYFLYQSHFLWHYTIFSSFQFSLKQGFFSSIQLLFSKNLFSLPALLRLSDFRTIFLLWSYYYISIIIFSSMSRSIYHFNLSASFSFLSSSSSSFSFSVSFSSFSSSSSSSFYFPSLSSVPDALNPFRVLVCII